MRLRYNGCELFTTFGNDKHTTSRGLAAKGGSVSPCVRVSRITENVLRRFADDAWRPASDARGGAQERVA